MNWFAVVGFAVLTYYAGPGDPEDASDLVMALAVCLLVGLLLGRAFA